MARLPDLDLDLRRLTPTVRAAFRLTSERHTLDHLLREVGIEGAVTWQKGESIASTALQRRTNGWCFELPPQRTYMLDDALTQLLHALAPHRDQIVALSRALELDAHVALDTDIYEDRVPTGYLSPANVKAIATYGASLGTEIHLAEPNG
ncbi:MULTISPECIES: DUF4279 domain-containing protein [Luteibacter]|uniref:DUF4279 domain-containing protein n=1 Tax=Luteibacter TaxID=242605 RepID=UPI00056D374E|nr:MULTISPECIES: DUF4279 domain-containing protein [unclassified Luteibacter]MDR6644642.1 hypothetical protein [Luteibacter sp. 1214]